MTPVAYPKEIVYPDSDGKPMADNTVQHRWIRTILGELESQFLRDPDVFVAGDLLWYPVEFDNQISAAPDVMIAFGRPKGDRGSYKQFEEGGIAPQVVFEILSPSNHRPEMREKLAFYDKYGVEEYYLYDPDREVLKGYRRGGDHLIAIPAMSGWTSPRLKIRFEMVDGDLKLYHPDGQPFASHTEIVERWHAAEAERDKVKAERDKVKAERDRIKTERDTAKTERDQANAYAAKVAAEKRESDDLAEKLRSRLRDLGISDV